MPRKVMTPRDWADFSRHIQNQGIAEFETNNLSEEEQQQMRRMFEDVWKAGYGHIHTLHVIPLDSDRQPYYVHVDDINRK
jgi:hypothetical protein